MAVARKSKDRKCLVGAVIVSQEDLVLATGYNGFPRGIHDDVKLLEERKEKLARTCHAETNAIFNAVRAGISVTGCRIYVNKFPCFDCCKAIVQVGLKKICTQDYEYWSQDSVDPDGSLKRDLLKQADIEVLAPFHPHFAPLKELILKTETTSPSNGDGTTCAPVPEGD
jgi:dCMP deaminase